jgi:prepilin-type processing-associated H-X9-DG protein
MLGGAFMCWGPDGAALTNPFTGEKKTGSYGINGYLYRAGGNYASADNDTSQLIGGGLAQSAARLWELPVKRSAEIPMVLDCIWDNGWPRESDPVPDTLYTSNNFSPMIGRFCIARHGMAVNVGFVDGHASTVQLPDLWRLPWHKQWNTMLINFPQITKDVKDRYRG